MVKQTLLVALVLLYPTQAFTQVIALDQNESLYEKRSGWLPYVFAADALGFAVGVAGSSAGTIQPQTSLIGTAYVTTNESALLSGSLTNFSLGKNSRTFLDVFFLANHFTDQRFYGGPAQAGEAPPGSNESDENSYISGISNELTFTASFKYRLPIGSIKDNPIAVYRVNRGMMESGPMGGKEWNPMTSGQTTFGTRLFYTYRDLSDFSYNQIDQEPNEELIKARTNGLKFWLEYNNTDFPRNPSHGSRQILSVFQDFGWFDSDNSWTNLQVDLSKYFDFGKSSWFRQKVVALNFWTANTTNWTEKPDGSIDHVPPPNFGSELGGYDRLRSYPIGRFQDKAAVYYAAELRLIPQTKPLRDLKLFKYFEMDWLQVVPFIEAGRVGPEYNTDLYFKDLHWNIGVGMRIMAFRAVMRLDFAVGEEGASAWAMVSQPFARPGS